jgi:hypothetical protein
LRVNNFHQLDVRVDKQYFFDKWSLMVYFDVQNLLNFQTASAPVYNRELDADGIPIIDPKNDQKYVLEKLETTSGTLLPTIGIMVEF